MKTLEQRLSEVHEYAFRKRHAMGYEKPYAERDCYLSERHYRS